MSDPEIFGPYAPVARLAALPDPATASAGEDARGGDSRAPTESRLSGPWAAVQAILRGATIVSPAVRVDLRGMPGYRSLVEERSTKAPGPGASDRENSKKSDAPSAPKTPASPREPAPSSATGMSSSVKTTIWTIAATVGTGLAVVTLMVNIVGNTETNLGNRIGVAETNLGNRIGVAETNLGNRIGVAETNLGGRIDGVEDRLGNRIDAVASTTRSASAETPFAEEFAAFGEDVDALGRDVETLQNLVSCLIEIATGAREIVRGSAQPSPDSPVFLQEPNPENPSSLTEQLTFCSELMASR